METDPNLGSQEYDSPLKGADNREEDREAARREEALGGSDEQNSEYDYSFPVAESEMQDATAKLRSGNQFVDRTFGRVRDVVAGVWDRSQEKKLKKIEKRPERKTSVPVKRRARYSTRYKTVWVASTLALAAATATSIWWIADAAGRRPVQAASRPTPRPAFIPSPSPTRPRPTETPTRTAIPTKKPTEPVPTSAPTFTRVPIRPPATAVPFIERTVQCADGSFVVSRADCPPIVRPEPQIIVIPQQPPAPAFAPERPATATSRPTATATAVVETFDPSIEAPTPGPIPEQPGLDVFYTKEIHLNSDGSEVEVKGLVQGGSQLMILTDEEDPIPYKKNISPDASSTYLSGFKRTIKIPQEDGSEISSEDLLVLNPNTPYVLAENLGDEENEYWTKSVGLLFKEVVDPIPSPAVIQAVEQVLATPTSTPRPMPTVVPYDVLMTALNNPGAICHPGLSDYQTNGNGGVEISNAAIRQWQGETKPGSTQGMSSDAALFGIQPNGKTPQEDWNHSFAAANKGCEPVDMRNYILKRAG